MAQLNPNFEIDFSDINSYEQIQLINDAQLARENLLMHRAYREPSDDEVIRQNYSSYTFIDFRPRIFAAKSLGQNNSSSRNSSSSRGLINTTLNESTTTTSNNNNNSNKSNQSCNSTGETFNNQSSSCNSNGNNSNNKPCYELEKFSSIFERINIWLKLNKEWQAVSVETLFYDSSTQFNHLRSSTYSNHLPKNTRGIRLHLSPFKSRFSGPQKIGCINVVPRRLNGSKQDKQEANDGPNSIDDSSSNDYENLDQILARLNELLLSRPIEGRILSVETITLPIINGRVDFECNYITDSRLNLLEQFTNCSADPQPPAGYRGDMRGHCLVDILRVYYEFGPMVCGLVNLIDFVPRFYSPTESCNNTDDCTTQNDDDDDDENEANNEHNDNDNEKNNLDNGVQQVSQNGTSETIDEPSDDLGLDLDMSIIGNRKSFASESLTRLIRRSLAWFEDESRRVLEASPAAPNANIEQQTNATKVTITTKDGITTFTNNGNLLSEGFIDDFESSDDHHLKLRLCNLQVHHKTFLKGELYKINASNILNILQTRTMIHQSKAPLINKFSKLNQLRKSSLGTELSQPYDVKFVRLAYVLPIYDRLSHTVFPLCAQLTNSDNNYKLNINRNGHDDDDQDEEHNDHDHHHHRDYHHRDHHHDDHVQDRERDQDDEEQDFDDSDSEFDAALAHDMEMAFAHYLEEIGKIPPKGMGFCFHKNSAKLLQKFEGKNSPESQDNHDNVENHANGQSGCCGSNSGGVQGSADNGISSIKRWALNIMEETNARHLHDEMAHQAGQAETDKLNESPIGQLTYRLFAPCQLVNSSSCFAINPINSSSPLARRGSVDLNGSGLSSDSAHPSALFPSGASPTASSSNGQTQELMRNNSHNNHQTHSIVNEVINEIVANDSETVDTNADCIPIIPTQTTNPSSSNSSSLPKELSSSLKSFGALFPSVFNTAITPTTTTTTTTIADNFANGSELLVNTARQLQAPIQALAQNIIADQNNHQQQLQRSRFTTNEFESVEAIRKRMEIYVTTNSMKVLAGETLIVNLSSNLSCLSNAIEQTVVRSSFARTRPSTWVSVYILYAAVDEPLIPSQLLAQQKLRELKLINEDHEEQDQVVDSKLKNNPTDNANNIAKKSPNTTAEELMIIQDVEDKPRDSDRKNLNNAEPIPCSSKQADAKLQSPRNSADERLDGQINQQLLQQQQQQQHDSYIIMSQYNSSYERIVALPTNPEDHMNHIDPGDYLEEQLESDILVAQQLHNIAAACAANLHDDPISADPSSNGRSPSQASNKTRSTSSSASSAAGKSNKKSRNKQHKGDDDAQCSII